MLQLRDALRDRLDDASHSYETYLLDKYHDIRHAATQEEADEAANTIETRHSYYAGRLLDSGLNFYVWLPATPDNLPDDGVTVNVCAFISDHYQIATGRYDSEYGGWIVEANLCETKGVTVSHWFPMLKFPDDLNLTANG